MHVCIYVPDADWLDATRRRILVVARRDIAVDVIYISARKKDPRLIPNCFLPKHGCSFIIFGPNTVCAASAAAAGVCLVGRHTPSVTRINAEGTDNSCLFSSRLFLQQYSKRRPDQLQIIYII